MSLRLVLRRVMPRAALFATVALVARFIAAPPLNAAKSQDAELERQFNETVRPFMATYCIGCHSGSKPQASFDLQPFSTIESVIRDHGHWAIIQQRLVAKEMPPKALKQPPEAIRQRVITWISEVAKNEARKNAGDPGPVLARRLSNAEYDNTIRDLTGVNLRPAREFPVDPANQAGFDNSGESLTMSPGLMDKYLQAARKVADHLVLKPDGLTFAGHPMLVETDREKYAVQRIVDFYDRQPTDFADYFQAAWRYKHRAALGKPKATLASMAAESKISPKYLPMVWEMLEVTKEEVGPGAKLQAMWRALPAPNGKPDVARDGCVKMRDFVVKIRKHTAKLITAPAGGPGGGGGGASPVAYWRNRQIALGHRSFDPTALRVEGEPPPGELVVTRGPTFGQGEAAALKRAVAAYIKERQEDPDLVVPAGQRARYEEAFARFSSVFPDKFALRERGRFYPIDTLDEGRLLAAGLHNLMGYDRDDVALKELILDEKGQQEIDKLWHEFEFIAEFTKRSYLQLFQSGGGGGRPGAAPVTIAKPTFNEAASEKGIFTMRDQALARLNATTNPIIVQAVKDHFEGINTTLRRIEKVQAEAEPRHLEALIKFASKAYRRPLEQEEREEILGYYRELREKSSMSHEEAMRASIVSLLVSPDFCYRVDLSEAGPLKPLRPVAAVSVRPLSNHALASRLSYFLWSSMPDDELRAHADAGDLAKPAVMLGQVRRMLKDDRARGLATEFAGNWLDFRRFETHNGVDRERFPSFTSQLREAMFEEPVRLIGDVVRNDRSLLDLLYGNYTFVNRVLAEHYGMPGVQGKTDEWVRVDNARAYGRGGLLPMAVFLTQNAPGLRTSPVKRGYWVARRVLGEVIPPPPPTVPELPKDESKSQLAVRDLLAKHRDNPACSSCHARFDSFGLAFEGYGPVGERRAKDLAGRAVDTRATFPGGREGDGLQGLQEYIRAHRERDFVHNISGKMLVYALGRSSVLSDEPLLERMRTRVVESGYRMSAMIETIVTSPQFLNRRNPETSSSTQTAKSRDKKGD